MFRVDIKDTYSMTDEERIEANVPKYRDFNMLQIYHNDELILEEIDSGEPEDNSFRRDYDWIKPTLEKVYALGVKDGASQVLDRIESALDEDND